jgi:hypothetical protein
MIRVLDNVMSCVLILLSSGGLTQPESGMDQCSVSGARFSTRRKEKEKET